MLRYKTETRSGLVALYDIRPGKGAGLFLQSRSPHGAGTDTDRSATYDLILLVIHSNHGSISYRFQDERWFRSKIAISSTVVYLTPPPRTFPLRFYNGGSARKTRIMLLPDGGKTLTICAFLYIQYHNATDSQAELLKQYRATKMHICCLFATTALHTYIHTYIEYFSKLPVKIL